MDYYIVKGNCKIPSFAIPTFQKAARDCAEHSSGELDYDTALKIMMEAYYDAWNGKKVLMFGFSEKDLAFQFGYEAYDVLKEDIENNEKQEKKRLLVKPIKKKRKSNR